MGALTVGSDGVGLAETGTQPIINQMAQHAGGANLFEHVHIIDTNR